MTLSFHLYLKNCNFYQYCALKGTVPVLSFDGPLATFVKFNKRRESMLKKALRYFMFSSLSLMIIIVVSGCASEQLKTSRVGDTEIVDAVKSAL